ncbi:adaptor protein [Niallia circulans]|jgi:adapter protein MecA 1/2|uniref:Adaptor protein n=1 Tax=Niallia circulans TaxID=1397 RepID=A0A0J1IP98_NIACI|nr:adaptor protein MecA [Niallia circulans]KLV27791.1 adaptor protein [Niallia circulans]MCM2980976.1 adaptor protein MecA [Niallia circulans]MDR4314584.1 adaptor protein [Niallia circulans]MED3840792.1 adaptor protein MecA [Niallia circulans]MED4242746.1 adaptor protein MecA [Niallia circulans]
MRLERLNSNRIKIHLTTDDLYERGLTKEDIWKDSIKWQYFFHEMLEEANDIFDMEIHGSVAVEIFSMKAQGMVMILTITETELDTEELLSEGFLEMQVTVEETVDILYEFTDIEYVIDAVKQLEQNNFKGGSLYNLNERYYLCFVDISSFKEEQIIAILSEFGEASLKSIYIIEEYGNVIKKDNAIETLVHFF